MGTNRCLTCSSSLAGLDPRAGYCSLDCKKAAKRKRYADANPAPIRYCVACSKSLKGLTPNRKHCSNECINLARRQKAASKRAPCGYCGVRLPINHIGRPGPCQECIDTACEAVGFQPDRPYPGGMKDWSGTCLVCSEEIVTCWNKIQVDDRDHCPVCRRRCPRCGEREVANKRGPAEWCQDCMVDFALQQKVRLIGSYPGKNDAPWPAECLECNDTFPATWSNVHSPYQGSCSSCGRNRTADAHRLDEQVALERMAAAKLQSLTPYPGNARDPWPSLCIPKAHRNELPLGQIKFLLDQKTIGCSFCRGSRVDPQEAHQVMLTAGARPRVPYPGKNSIGWESDCLKGCGQVIFPTYSQAQQQLGLCSNCAEPGIKLGEPGFLYLMRNESLQAWKYGIANVGSSRVQAHIREGWSFIESQAFDTAREANEIEQDFKHWCQTQDLDHLPQERMPQGGYTETVTFRDMPLLTLEELIRQVKTQPPHPV